MFEFVAEVLVMATVAVMLYFTLIVVFIGHVYLISYIFLAK